VGDGRIGIIDPHTWGQVYSFSKSGKKRPFPPFSHISCAVAPARPRARIAVFTAGMLLITESSAAHCGSSCKKTRCDLVSKVTDTVYSPMIS